MSPRSDPAVDLQEALVMVRLLRRRLTRERGSGPDRLAEQREARAWRVAKLKRRLAYWTRRATRLRVQLQEVSDEYPCAYLSIVRAADQAGPRPGGRGPLPATDLSRRDAA